MKFIALFLAFFSLALLAYADGPTPIKNGRLQNDFDAGGNNITNIGGLYDTQGNPITGGGTNGGSGNVTGDSSSTAGEIPIFTGTTGKAIGRSGFFTNSFDAAGSAGNVQTFANGSSNSLQIQIADTNAALFALSNGVSPADRHDLDGLYGSLEPVWGNFMDGILFQPRFGTNTSLKLNTVTGYRGNYTPDNWGINLTNGLSLQMPGAFSNVTVVMMVKDIPMWLQPASGAGSVLWALGNTTTKSGIVAASSTVFDDSRWLVQETYHYSQWPGANNGSFSNLFNPLRMDFWDWNGMGDMEGYPLIMAWQRDVNGNWRMYLNTVQGKISLNNPTLVYQSPTNATDPLSLFTMGFDSITNEPNMSTHTNVNVASVFVFNTTNYSAVIAGYQAAYWANGSDTAEFMFGDSRLNDVGTLTPNPGQYYQRRLNPLTYFIDHAQGGARADLFDSTGYLGNGGLAEITNIPRGKIKNLNVIYSLGVNDGYLAGESGSQIFQQYTNAIYQFVAAGAQVTFCDTYQVATNSSFLSYSLATETNIYQAGLMIRTNATIPIAKYVPLRDAIPQSIIQTNGLFSVDGTHVNGRTNGLAQQRIADLIFSPQERTITNGPIGPLDEGNSVVGGGGNFSTNSTDASATIFGPLTNASPAGITSTNLGDAANTNLVASTKTGQLFTVAIGSGLTYNAATKTLSAPTGGSGDVVAANNLSEYTATESTARANIGAAASATTVTINGTSGQISSSAGAQDLSANRTWTLSLDSHVVLATNLLGWSVGQTVVVSAIDASGHIVLVATNFSNTNGFASTNQLLNTTNLSNVPGFAYFYSNTNIGPTWDGGGLTNLQTPEIVLTPTSNATNYTLNFSAARKQLLIPNGTNANFTFSNVATNREIDLYVDNTQQSNSCIITFPAHIRLNHYAALVVTNGQAGYYHVDAYSGTDPTNCVVTGGDYYTVQ